MIVTLVAGSQPRPVGGVTSRYEYANALCRRGHRVHLVHASWFRRCVTSLDEIPWFAFEPGIEHHFVRPGERFEFPEADVINEPALGLPERHGLPFRFHQGMGLFGGPDPGRGVYETHCPVVCISSWLVDDALAHGVPGRMLVHVPHGLDHAAFRLHTPFEHRRPQVAMLHHPAPIKGATVGLAALERARYEVPDLSAVLFGTEAPAVRLPGWVRFVEHPPRTVLVDEIYNGSQVFLGTSYWGEGLGKTQVEAMACGAALVTTANGGSGDFAFHGETALVGEPGDAEALAAHVVALLGDDDLRFGIARRGCEYVQRFDWDASAHRLEEFLLDYLADPGRYRR